MTATGSDAAPGPGAERHAPPTSLVAVIGPGRNGSTLLQRLLDGSPDLYVHPVEVNYLCIFEELARRGRLSQVTLQNATTRPLTKLDAPVSTELLLRISEPQWTEIETDYLEGDGTERRDRARAALGQRDRYGVDEFLPEFLEATRRAYDERRERRPTLVFKTIETPYVDDYATVFPAMRFLHIVRDPIANYASIKRTWIHRKQLSFYSAGHDILRTFLDARWLPHAEAVVRLTAEQPERHQLVRYEDLVAAPVQRIGEICGWLGVAPPPEPDLQTVFGGRRAARFPQAPSKPGLETPERVVPNMAARFGYDDVISPRERALIVRCTRSLAAKLGYEGPAGDANRGLLRSWLAWLPVDESEGLHVESRPRWVWALLRRRAYVLRKLLQTTWA